MRLLFSIAMPTASQAELEDRVAKGAVVPLDELKQKYSPAAADTKDLVSWLEGQGFKVTQVAADNTGVYAETSVRKIEKSLAVNMVRVTKEGLTYTAAQNVPSMPADVARNVQAIIGLQPFRKAQKHFRICSPKAGNRTSLAAVDVVNEKIDPAVTRPPPGRRGWCLKENRRRAAQRT
jgi:kumamolisin